MFQLRKILNTFKAEILRTKDFFNNTRMLNFFIEPVTEYWAERKKRLTLCKLHNQIAYWATKIRHLITIVWLTYPSNRKSSCEKLLFFFIWSFRIRLLAKLNVFVPQRVDLVGYIVGGVKVKPIPAHFSLPQIFCPQVVSRERRIVSWKTLFVLNKKICLITGLEEE